MVGRNLLSELSSDYEILSPKRNELDLLNYDDLDNFLKLNKPDIIIHCAGHVGGIQSNLDYPLEYLDINLKIGQNLIFSAVQNQISNFLNFSSSCVYSPNSLTPLKEDSFLENGVEKTNEGYALAKIIIQKYCEYVNKSYSGFSYKTVVPCNLYGEYDKFDPNKSHLIPAIIYKINKAIQFKLDKVEIWGDGSAKREFMYIKDLTNFISFYLRNYNKMPPIINVGLENDFSVKEYYQIIGNLMGFKGRFFHNLDKPVGMKRKKIDITKLKNLGWEAGHTLEEGLQKTIKYFYENEI